MSQPYDPGYGGGPQQPWGTPGQQPPGGYPGQQDGYPQQSGYPQQGGHPQPGGYPQQPGAYTPAPAPPQHGYPPQYPQPQGPPPQGYGAPPAWQAASSPRKGSPAGIGVAIAGALMALGTLLPWVSVKLQFGSTNLYGTALPTSNISRSIAGIRSGEGKIVLLCALAAIVLGIVAMVNNAKLGLIAAAPAVIAILVILKVFADKASYDDKVPSLGSGSSGVHVSLSAGIYLSLIMAIAVIGLGVICAVTSRSR
jgi:hypothetical protein